MMGAVTLPAAILAALALSSAVATARHPAAPQANTGEPRRAIAVLADDPSVGPASARVTVVEFADFQCPFCRRMSDTLRQVRQRYGDRVRIVWKDFPLTKIHQQAMPAAQAARCAAEQGRFWDYHDRLFAAPALDAATLRQHAVALALDLPRFNACVDSSKYAETVQRSRNEALALGLTSTPTLFVNGRMIKGAKSYDLLAGLIDEELAAETR